MMEAYGRAGRVPAMQQCFVEMTREGVRPDVHTFTALMHGFGR